MISLLKKLFVGKSMDWAKLIADGAQVIDVRSPAEYQSGHIKGSVNIPLPLLKAQLGSLKKDRPVITCCASGMRSASAKGILKSNGFPEVHNGGGWQSLQQKLS